MPYSDLDSDPNSAGNLDKVKQQEIKDRRLSFSMSHKVSPMDSELPSSFFLNEIDPKWSYESYQNKTVKIDLSRNTLNDISNN